MNRLGNPQKVLRQVEEGQYTLTKHKDSKIELLASSIFDRKKENDELKKNNLRNTSASKLLLLSGGEQDTCRV